MILNSIEHCFDISIPGVDVFIINIFQFTIFLLILRTECWSEDIQRDGNVPEPDLELCHPGVDGEGEVPLVVDGVNVAEVFKEHGPVSCPVHPRH